MRVRAVVMVVAAALAAGGCGSSGGGAAGPSTSASAGASISADGFVHQICTALAASLVPLKSRVDTTRRALAHDESAGDLAAAKQDLLTLISASEDAYGALRNGLARAGVPAVPGGAQARAEMLGGVDRVLSALETAKSQVASIPTGNRQRFDQARSRIGKAVTAAGQRIGRQLSTSLGGQPQLSQAASRDPACQRLSSALS